MEQSEGKGLQRDRGTEGLQRDRGTMTSAAYGAFGLLGLIWGSNFIS